MMTHSRGAAGAAPQVPEKTLRDEFAMSALTGLLAVNSVNGDQRAYARAAYATADAMMEARKQ